MYEPAPILATIFLTSTGIMIFAGFVFLGYGLVSVTQKRYFLIIGSSSLIASAYNFFTFFYLTSIDITESILWMKLQSICITLFFPLYLWFILISSNHKKADLIFRVFLIPSFIILVIKITSPTAAKLIEVTGNKTVELPWGEIIHVVQGSAHPAYIFTLIGPILIITWSIIRGYKMIAMGNPFWGYTFTLTSIGFLICSLMTIMITNGYLKFFYTGGLIFGAYVIAACLKIFVDTHKFRINLEKTNKIRVRHEETLFHITKTINHQYHGNYYDELVKNIQKTFQIEMVFISLYNPENSATIIAFQRYGDKLNPFTYKTKDTPFEDIRNNIPCSFGKNIQEKYPQSEFLKKYNAQSFIGRPIYNEKLEIIGNLVIMDQEIMGDLSFNCKTLDIFVNHLSNQIQQINNQKQLELLAYTDYLTGLYNRPKFYLSLSETLESTIKFQHNCTLFYLDLDKFKDINSFLGNEMADHILMILGHRFLNQEIEGMTSYRLTGDEFLFIHEKYDKEIDSRNTAQRLHDLVVTPIIMGDHHIQINCSIGYIEYPSQVQAEEDILQFAETALKQAKEIDSQHQSKIFKFDPTFQKSLNQKKDLEEELRQAIHQDHFELYIQPQIDENELPFGGEFLIRWNHKERGFISPTEFIPLAEESELMEELGEWVLEEAIKHIARWRNNNIPYPPHMSINISAKQFDKDNFIAKITKLIDDYKVPPSHIVLEVTETAVVDDQASTIKKLKHLQKLGFEIALDDFGTGYSSLAYLKDLPINYIKIDKTFVDPLEHEETDGLVETIISMGRHMRLNVIAEGTVTEAQVMRLKQYGCKLFQGYYYARPMPVTDFENWILRKLG